MKEKNGLYIHIPYCEHKCFYCDFSSYTGREDTVHAYIDACLKESEKYEGVPIDTIYIGGGTPSFIDEKEILRLLKGIGDIFDVDPSSEVSIECNPNSVDPDKLFCYRDAGINRLSIGLQTTDDEMLKRIGRIHSFSDFERAVDASVRTGFSNISADLMYALPGQTILDVRKDVERILSFPLKHISAYELRLERGTPLYGQLQPDDDTDREMFDVILEGLRGAGFERYEISNFALPGYWSRHNYKYWELCGYVGIGAAAHSFMEGKRYANTANLDEYIKKNLNGGSAMVYCEDSDRTEEEIMLSLRTTKGLKMSHVGLESTNGFIIKMVDNGLAVTRGGYLVLTDRGMDIHNSIVVALLEELGI
ncbi:MAG: radical SAM family heme chaperone HemW [Clostridia bacterium]|nr:radical SAM family heme chaperone HemW [Clostridia bacterium]